MSNSLPERLENLADYFERKSRKSQTEFFDHLSALQGSFFEAVDLLALS